MVFCIELTIFAKGKIYIDKGEAVNYHRKKLL